MVGIIQSVNEEVQELVSNSSPVLFKNTDIRTPSANCSNGGWLNHNEETAQYTLLSGGYYKISVNMNVTAETTGQVALALLVDGVQSSGTEMDASIETANNWKNVSFTKWIRVCGRGNVVLTINSIPTILVNNVATDTQIPIIKNAKMTIERYT